MTQKSHPDYHYQTDSISDPVSQQRKVSQYRCRCKLRYVTQYKFKWEYFLVALGEISLLSAKVISVIELTFTGML